MSVTNLRLPKTTQQALRHLNMIEDNRTPLLAVFCIHTQSAKLKDIRKAYKRLASFVHPDRCLSDPRGANRSMRTLARAMEIVESQLQYDQACNRLEHEGDFVLHSSMFYCFRETAAELWLRDHEQVSREGESAGKSFREQKGSANDGKEEKGGGSEDTGNNSNAEENRQEHADQAAREHAERQRAKEILRQRAKEKKAMHDKEQCLPQREKDMTYVENEDQREYTSFTNQTEEANDLSGAFEDVFEEELSDLEEDMSNPDSEYCPSNYIVFNEPIESITSHAKRAMFVGDNATCSNMQGDYTADERSEGDAIDDKTRSHEAGGANTFERTAHEIKRTKQKRASKRRTMQRAKLALQAEKVGSLTWRPHRCVEIVPAVGMALQFRSQCEQLIRAHTAYVGVHKGVNISQTWEKVRMKCRSSDCAAVMTFNWQPKTGLWKMNQYIPHGEDCCSHEVSDAPSNRNVRSFCAPAYTPHQVARTILSEAANDPNISARSIGALVPAKQIYRRQPPDSHYRSVRLEIFRHVI